ncbi:tRNA-binding protein [Afipia sp. Root123D2]|uniref:tRNA-binding protein n=1 Tax=Afipia sp. Root123D2 TaxID=1736436 RepID=UPI0006F2C3FE|nr:tRNA-binding protein [Afipia sp. Root123D2]KQW21090.1 tRNA-binding protein [Afipia sp. Root123D2]
MPSSPITYDDFAKVDLRAGRVLEVLPFPKARNPSWKVRVDLGEMGEKWSSAQITNYTAEELMGSLVVCVCNFAPRNIAGFMSEVLILGAPDQDGKVIVLSPRSAHPGTVISPGAKVY